MKGTSLFFVATGLAIFAFCFIPPAPSKATGKLSDRDMRNTFGGADCTEYDDSCHTSTWITHSCNKVASSTISPQGKNESDEEFQERKAKDSPSCRAPTGGTGVIAGSSPFKNFEGEDTEFEKKHLCLTREYCTDTGEATSQSEEDKSNILVKACKPSSNPDKYCKVCSGAAHEPMEDNLQPNLLKCSEGG